MENINKYIGQNLRNLRKEYGLSLEEMSKKTGLSKSMLSSIENGSKSPTISSLWKICDHFNIPLSKLTYISKPKLVKVVRKDQNIIMKDELQLFASLFEFDEDRKFEMYYHEFQPGCHHDSSGHNAQVTEYVLVAEGSLTISINQEVFELVQGEGIQFLATIPHTYTNNSDQPLKMFSVLYYDE